MSEYPRLRQGVRALILDTTERVLLVQFELPHIAFWAAPGGGIEPGETPNDALRRELVEETGLTGCRIGPEIWTRTHVFPFLDGSYDGQIESFYLVETEPFEPEPALSWDQLRREYLSAIRWWSIHDLQDTEDLFAPRAMPRLVAGLITHGPPTTPIEAGI